MSRIVCPGSFDPVHNGHVDIITRAARLFDEVIVAVSTNPAKTYRFDLEERLALCEDALSHLDNTLVLPMGGGLIADFCRQHGAAALVKGLRSGHDFEYEVPMAAMNRYLTDVDTVFLPGAAESAHVSSSLVKEVAGLGGDIRPFVPPAVFRALSPGSDGGPSSGADSAPTVRRRVLGEEPSSG
jgi:pantetheine-phosphate adenylyltransferase